MRSSCRKRRAFDPQWKLVVEALVAKHQAKVVRYDHAVDESLPALKRQMPRYICFVAQPTEASEKFVAEASRLTRRLDDDPYTDAIWGILTGYDAKCAVRIANEQRPLVIHRVGAATEVDLALCDEGVWYSELSKGKMVRKEAGKSPHDETGPADSTKALVDTLNDYHADLFVTSGHASERNWMIGYSYPNGQFRSAAGQLFGVDTAGKKLLVRSDNPKVYLPVGNCLMGHINGPDSMALAYMNSAGVDQMIGYTVPTWYGYGGWGMLDYFVEQPGRYTLAEAFFANQQALIHRLETYFPGAAKTDSDTLGDNFKLSDAAVKSPFDAQRRPRTALRPRHGGPLRRSGLVGQNGAGSAGLGSNAERKGERIPVRDQTPPRRQDIRHDRHQRLAARRSPDRAALAPPR